MKLLPPDQIESIVSNPEIPPTADRKSKIARHLEQTPEKMRAVVIDQLLKSMSADEVFFLKLILGLESMAAQPKARKRKLAEPEPEAAPTASDTATPAAAE